MVCMYANSCVNADFCVQMFTFVDIQSTYPGTTNILEVLTTMSLISLHFHFLNMCKEHNIQSNLVIMNAMGPRILFDIAVIRNTRERKTCMY
jgi:hypothetical protein